MLTAALTVSDSLGFGFDRAAHAAGLPDIIVRFFPQPADRVDRRIAALPDVASYTVRQELTGIGLDTANDSADNGVVEILGPDAAAMRSWPGATCRTAPARWLSSAGWLPPGA